MNVEKFQEPEIYRQVLLKLQLQSREILFSKSLLEFPD